MNQDIKELFGALLIIVFIIAGLQWLLLRFTHWSVALAATGFISLFISFIYVSLKHASPNGGSRGPAASEYITPSLVVFTALLCGLAVVYYLMNQNTQRPTPKLFIILPLCLIFML